jgi:ATP-binding cassette subfamily C protein LapB
MTKAFNYAKCIRPLLETLNWQGAIRRIYEAIPYLMDNLSILDLRNMMANLGYVSTHKTLTISSLSEVFCPCLFVAPQEIYILLKKEGGMIHAIDCRTQKRVTLSEKASLKGNAYTFSPHAEQVPDRRNWLFSILWRFRSFFYRLMSLGFLTSMLSVSAFLFVMSIYDTIVPTRSEMTLGYVILGLGLALGCIQFIHVIQNRVLSYLSARLDMIVGTEVMRQVMNLPLSLIEEMPVAAQVSQLRELDGIREMFTEPVAQILLEGPAMIVFIIALYWIGGPIVFIPLGMLLAFCGLWILLFPVMQRTTRCLSAGSLERRKFLLESTAHLATIKHLDAEKTWVDRFRGVSASALIPQKHLDILSSFAINLSQTIMKISSLAVILWGAIRVTEGVMTVGALIAVMLLVWRSLSPLQNVCLVLGRLDQMANCLGQINRLMSLPTERCLPLVDLPSFEGVIRVQNVGFRYPNTLNPALQGIMMETKPGEVIAIVGANGSGKTTLLKLLLGFYAPQAGSIAFDGVDSRQFDPLVLRQSIAYVPQKIQFFQGTLAQNLSSGQPDATDEEIMEAAKKAGIFDKIMTLPEGFETRIESQVMHLFSSGFLQRLNLARAYVRKSKIMIMDEPGNTLDQEGDEMLRQTIKEFRKNKTILIVTHCPGLIALADRVLSLQNGIMQAFGPKEEVLKILQENQCDW